jgi:hypothetical protein
MAATRDKTTVRAQVDVARKGEPSRVLDAPGGAWLLCLLLLCVLFLGGCSANAPSADSTTSAVTHDSNSRPVQPERGGGVRANEQLSPTVAGAENPTSATTKGAPDAAGSNATASASSNEQESADASAAYEGFYEVLGARPKGFEQFGNFMIRAPQGGRVSGAVVPLEGELYEFARATLANRKLTFVTRKVGGVHYSFDGQFLAAPPFANDKKAAVAEGLVKKFQGDKVAAEANMKFYFDEGGEDP